MKLNEIQDLIKFVAKSGVSEVELETKDVKITIKTPGSKGKAKEAIPPLVQVAATPQPIAQAPVEQQTVVAAPAAQTVAAAAPPATPATKVDDDSKYVVVKSPMIGTFYRASGPDKAPFVSIGDEIKPGKVTCIIEAMKLFNEVESEISGKIVKVLVDDMTPVEYDQPLFLVDPS